MVWDGKCWDYPLPTSHPPVFYISPEDIVMDLLIKTARTSSCEFKGMAVYINLVMPDVRIENVAWAYENSVRGYEAIKDHLAFYPSKIDACYVDGERVKAREGDFYGGWITAISCHIFLLFFSNIRISLQVNKY